MNTRLTQLEAKLRAYRLSDSSSELESLITEIYDAVLDQEIYGSLWDEPILLGIKELLREDPPNEEVFGAAARFLKDRQVQVSAINDVFYKIIDTSLEHALERCAASRPFYLRMSWRPLQTSQGLALGSGRDLFQSPGQVDQTFDIVGG